MGKARLHPATKSWRWITIARCGCVGLVARIRSRCSRQMPVTLERSQIAIGLLEVEGYPLDVPLQQERSVTVAENVMAASFQLPVAPEAGEGGHSFPISPRQP